MINISQNAQKYLVHLLSKEPSGTQIRVFIHHPGTENAECGLSYFSENEIEKSDIKFQYKNFCVYVHSNIIAYLKNAEIDLIVDAVSQTLFFKAPYAKNNFSSKKYTLEEKVQNFLNMQINPQLLMHGGQVDLIKIDNSIAKIKFQGGCNGCSMIGSTLKHFVEKKILDVFPEIKSVYDVTEHLHGNHSFY